MNYEAMNGRLVDTRMEKAILMRSQTEISNVLSETEGKAILVKQWQKAGLECVCVLGM